MPAGQDLNDVTAVNDNKGYPPIEPIAAGLKGRCPRCGKGRLFSGLLSIAPDCDGAFG